MSSFTHESVLPTRYAEVILKRNAARVAALEAQEKGEKAAAKDAAPAPTPTPAAPVAAPVIPEGGVVGCRYMYMWARNAC
jgi:hypothetical protein